MSFYQEFCPVCEKETQWVDCTCYECKNRKYIIKGRTYYITDINKLDPKPGCPFCNNLSKIRLEGNLITCGHGCPQWERLATMYWEFDHTIKGYLNQLDDQVLEKMKAEANLKTVECINQTGFPYKVGCKYKIETKGMNRNQESETIYTGIVLAVSPKGIFIDKNESQKFETRQESHFSGYHNSRRGLFGGYSSGRISGGTETKVTSNWSYNDSKFINMNDILSAEEIIE